jgi:uncharacterized protein YcbK (DUF882 family)
MNWYKIASYNKIAWDWKKFLEGIGISVMAIPTALSIILSLNLGKPDVIKALNESKGSTKVFIDNLSKQKNPDKNYDIIDNTERPSGIQPETNANVTPQSKEPVAKEQPKQSLKTETSLPEGHLSKDFSLREFQCKDGSITPKSVISNLEELAQNLQVLRDTASSRIRITSGYRSPKYNKRVGGAGESQHVYGRAADIQVDGLKPKEVYNLIEQLIADGKMKQGGLGLYPTFVHYDVRGNRARW